MENSRSRSFRRTAGLLAGALSLALVAGGGLRGSAQQAQGLNQEQDGPLSPQVLQQINALLAEKRARTPAQQKIDSQLLYTLKMRRNQPIAPGVPTLQTKVKLENDGSIVVDMNAWVSNALLDQIVIAGGQIINAFPEYHSIRARIPLASVEFLAGLTAIKNIRPADQAMTSAGSVDSEGDITHKADVARNLFGVIGVGLKVGVLSDGVNSRFTAQNSGDLNPLTVISGQAGSGDEGTAMSEIVHDLVPGAAQYFATAFNGVSSFANNIRALRNAGCDVIVDDVVYFNESPFQDGPIAQAVNDVTASGALYFSSAGNEGNLTDGTSGCWEGDFVDGGDVGAPINGVESGRVHKFSTLTYDRIPINGGGAGLDLFWSDPLGASSNDYDLFLLNSTGTTIVDASTNTQNGSQDPYEHIANGTSNQRIVIVKFAGDARFLHLDNFRGVLATKTNGATRGHNSAAASYGTAAVDVHLTNPFPSAFTGGPANPVESYSSDGPRHVFYNADGSAITPGNFLSTGGAIRQKPELAAADGVSTTLSPGSGFNPFYGTSAAAPHAAALAALAKSFSPLQTPAQMHTLLTTSNLDIMANGVDRDSGAGILMADLVLQNLAAPKFTISGTVTGSNNAGLQNVTVSAVGNAAASLRQSAMPVASIPDNSTTGVTSNQSVSTTGTIAAVHVAVYVSHPHIGDLVVSLIHPDGTTVKLHNQTGTTTKDIVTFYPDVTAPNQSLSNLVGKAVNGTWKLKVQDLVSGNTGTLQAWTLWIDYTNSATFNTSTASNGTYTLNNIPAGTYTLTAAKNGFKFNPTSISVTVGPNQTGQNFQAVATVSGTVTLQQAVNQAQPVDFEFRPTSGSPFTITKTLGADGSFSIPNVPLGNYTLAIKGYKWLRKNVTVNATSGDVSNVAATLLGGDATGDNFVDIDDLGALSFSYGTSPSDPRWSDACDFTCDGFVDIDDLGLLSGNYGKQGDN